MKDLPETIRKCLREKVTLEDVGKFLDVIDKNTFEFERRELTMDFASRFGFKGPLMDSELPVNQVKQFLDESKEIFEKIADEHIKKFNEHKLHRTVSR